MNPEELHDILSGKRHSLSAVLCRLGLSLAEPFYNLGVQTIRFLYNNRLKAIHRVSRPVISVGNITTGGTGKTPFTALLVKLLQAQGHKPGIASRGYHAIPAKSAENSSEPGQISRAVEQGNDEKRMLDQICPGTPHLQSKDRAGIARQLIHEFSCDRILLDDGFQHRKLHRDLDLVLIDAVNPFGYGHLLPRGLLREPLTSLGRADLIVLTRVDQVPRTEIERIQEVLRYFTHAPLVEVSFQATGWLDAAGNVTPLTELPIQPVVFCGIGNPRNFQQQLQQLGVSVAGDCWRPFPDHHHYTATEMEQLAELARKQGGELLTTHKDLVKLEGLLPSHLRCRALLIEAVITQGKEFLDQALSRLPVFSEEDLGEDDEEE